MAMAAAIFDLDRTLIASSSAPIFAQHIADAGIADTPSIPFADLFLKYYEHFGESRLAMAPSSPRGALLGRVARRWRTRCRRNSV